MNASLVRLTSRTASFYESSLLAKTPRILAAVSMWAAVGAANAFEPPAMPPQAPAAAREQFLSVAGTPVASVVTIQVPVTSAMSLVHVGSNDSFSITPEGRQAANDLFDALQALDGKDSAKMADKARAAIDIYAKIIPRENYGGEYTALQWFAEYLLAGDAERAAMTADPFVNEFFKMFGGDDYAVLKEYLKRKYRVALIGDEETRAGQDRKAFLEDTLLFENPRRETWEHTKELMALLDLKPGMKIADVGSGPGYYTFRFAKLVGPSGHVFAIDTVGEHLKTVEHIRAALGLTNVETIQTDGKTLGLEGRKVDAVFLCSLYHNIYAMATAPDRDAFVHAIQDALTDDGVLYLADNGLVKPGVLPYHGPYIAKELIIAQMVNYGFDLVRQHQHIPQRYLLVFKKRPAGQAPAPLPDLTVTTEAAAPSGLRTRPDQ
jgi:predicted methyltransferase